MSIAGINEEFADELGRPPTTGELVELCAYGLRTLDDALDVDMARLTGLNARYRDEAPADETNEVDELNDAAWEEAVSLVHELVKANDTLEGLLAELVTMLQGAGHDDLVAIEAELKPLSRQRRPKVGDIVEIRGRRAVVVAKDRGGTAIGVLDGETPALRHPLYTEDEPVVEGRWPIVGQDKALPARFLEPERFHLPHSVPHAHGAAERLSDDRLRPLSAEEAHEAGLDRPDFRQFFSADELEAWLSARLR